MRPGWHRWSGWGTPSAVARQGWSARRIARAALPVLLVATSVAVLVGLAPWAHAQPAKSPQRETWVTVAPMPELRQEAAVIGLNGKVYVMGGYTNDSPPSSLVQVYDVATDRWSQAAPMPQPVHHAGVAAAGGQIYIIGGFLNVFGERDPIDAVWAYDPATDRWARRAPLPSPRGAGVAATIDDRIYLIGGEQRRTPGGPPSPSGAPAGYQPVADLTVYDPATDSWERLPSMRIARDHLVADAIDGRLYAVAGRDRPIYDIPYLEEYDPARGYWLERAPMPTGRSGGNGATLNGKLYVFGGEGNPNSPLGIYDEVEAYDPTTDTWTRFGPMPVPRHSFGAAVVGNRIYLPGGSLIRGSFGANVTTLMDAFEPN